jgi:hypothetical protein
MFANDEVAVLNAKSIRAGLRPVRGIRGADLRGRRG